MASHQRRILRIAFACDTPIRGR